MIVVGIIPMILGALGALANMASMFFADTDRVGWIFARQCVAAGVVVIGIGLLAIGLLVQFGVI